MFCDCGMELFQTREPRQYVPMYSSQHWSTLHIKYWFSWSVVRLYWWHWKLQWWHLVADKIYKTGEERSKMKYWAFAWKGTSLLWQCHHWHRRVRSTCRWTWSTCQHQTWSTSQRRTWSTCQHRWQTWRTAAKCGDRLHHRLGSISPGSWESKVIK